jgi:PQQ-dependent dehydrogenase (methanol/ethanol family)
MLRPIARRGAPALFVALAFAAGSPADAQPAALALSSPPAAAQPFARAPAFGAAELVKRPAENWITNGGNVYNQRYSTLEQINRGNVAQVKAVWRVSLNGSGLGQGYSQQAQALFYGGVLYVVTGDDDAFAVDVESGKILWTYEANVDFENAIICCGRLSRGVGLGDGKVYVGRLDGRLVALDQLTGKVVWDIRAGDPGISEGITAAPLYYDGKVIVGFTGGEYAVRGRISAYDAKTGKRIWNFYTVPGPGEIGHATWPQDNEAWKYGGAPVWQTPSVDPELGMIYFSTGNAAPDLNGAIRAGDNLFTVSLLALDAATGEYRWHFQLVRHDIWDFDAANPTILFDADFDGMPRKASRRSRRPAISTSSIARAACRSRPCSRRPCRRTEFNALRRRSPFRRAIPSCATRSTRSARASRASCATARARSRRSALRRARSGARSRASRGTRARTTRRTT